MSHRLIDGDDVISDNILGLDIEEGGFRSVPTLVSLRQGQSSLLLIPPTPKTENSNFESLSGNHAQLLPLLNQG
jgi:hypothetical protein